MTEPSSEVELQVLPDLFELSLEAARVFTEHARSVIAARGRFRVALSGGSTPKRLYQLLAGPSVNLNWDHIDVFLTDERHVPPQHDDSNYRMVHETLLSHVPLPAANIHRVLSELPDANEAALDYEQTLKNVFELKATELPRFDLMLLGLGADAHTASIFPDTPGLLETHRLVQAPWIEKLKSHRITLTMPVINNSAAIIFLVSESEKAEALRHVLQEEPNYRYLPAQAVRPTRGTVQWLVDSAAARSLDRY
jgi:6-phosphogluconolactonase